MLLRSSCRITSERERERSVVRDAEPSHASTKKTEREEHLLLLVSKEEGETKNRIASSMRTNERNKKKRCRRSNRSTRTRKQSKACDEIKPTLKKRCRMSHVGSKETDAILLRRMFVSLEWSSRIYVRLLPSSCERATPVLRIFFLCGSVFFFFFMGRMEMLVPIEKKKGEGSFDGHIPTGSSGHRHDPIHPQAHVYTTPIRSSYTKLVAWRKRRNS